MVSDPVLSCSFDITNVVKLDPERIRLGVTVVLIELVSSKLFEIVRVCEPVFLQFTVLLDINVKLDRVEVKKEIGAAPVFVT